MSSYAADLEAIFSAPYESVEGEDQMEEETARPREEVAAPLMTSTPHVKGGNSPASTDSTNSPRDQYETMEEGDREAPSAGSPEKPSVSTGSSVVDPTDQFSTPPKEQRHSPNRSPPLNISVNPLNAMANSIAEAFKKRSPTSTSRASFVVASSTGSNGVESSLKYKPLTFDDDEQLPICNNGGGNLNTNNNNSSGGAGGVDGNLANNGGVTTYGTGSNQGGLRGSGRRGPFGDRVRFRSPFSVLVVILGIILVFLVIICLSALGQKAKEKNHRHHHHSPSHHLPRQHSVPQNRGGGTAQNGHKIHQAAAGNLKKSQATISDATTKQRQKFVKKLREKKEELKMKSYVALTRQMTKLSNRSDVHFLPKWHQELVKQILLVEARMMQMEHEAEMSSRELQRLAESARHNETTISRAHPKTAIVIDVPPGEFSGPPPAGGIDHREEGKEANHRFTNRTY